jgi:hypothetical protein
LELTVDLCNKFIGYYKAGTKKPKALTSALGLSPGVVRGLLKRYKDQVVCNQKPTATSLMTTNKGGRPLTFTPEMKQELRKTIDLRAANKVAMSDVEFREKACELSGKKSMNNKKFNKLVDKVAGRDIIKRPCGNTRKRVAAKADVRNFVAWICVWFSLVVHPTLGCLMYLLENVCNMDVTGYCVTADTIKISKGVVVSTEMQQMMKEKKTGHNRTR